MLRDFQATAGAGTGLHALNGRAPAIGVGAFIAPGAQLIGDVRVGDRASVWYNAVLRGDLAPVIIGAETNVQDGCVLHVDEGRPCIIGARVTLGHMAIVHGATIEDECLIGIQSTILSGAVIRRHSIVGAAALVAEGKAFPPNSVLLGVPAKPVREVQPEEVDHLIVARAREYAALAANELQAREGPVGPRPAEASAPRSGRGGG
ncbi:MAG: gamma carbonic anhydrase family protein [Actinobacteria bacterium]|nr:gamma carbonic anhydrase family protein [Actinomycetota bacterium]